MAGKLGLMCSRFLRTPRGLSHARSFCSAKELEFDTLAVSRIGEHVLHVELNRPSSLNALNMALWKDFRMCFQKIAEDSKCRAVILSGAGKMFSAGLDFKGMAMLMSQITKHEDIARRSKPLHSIIREVQTTFDSLEQCPQPIVSATHNACIGGAMGFLSAADVRYCTEDAYFQIKEVDIGIAADVGTLQRLPRLVGNHSLLCEMVYTAKKVGAREAKEMGLVSGVFKDKEEMLQAATKLATAIAARSPVAVQGSKINMLYSRDHSVDDGMRFHARWNQQMLQSQDLMTAAAAAMTKSSDEVTFDDY